MAWLLQATEQQQRGASTVAPPCEGSLALHAASAPQPDSDPAQLEATTAQALAHRPSSAPAPVARGRSF
eukprot:3323691-Rhodomonas_salina.3